MQDLATGRAHHVHFIILQATRNAKSVVLRSQRACRRHNYPRMQSLATGFAHRVHSIILQATRNAKSVVLRSQRRNRTGIKKVEEMKRGGFIQVTNLIHHTPLQSIWKRLKETKEKRSKCGMKASPLKVDRRRTPGDQMIA